jgi:hypothetical protein
VFWPPGREHLFLLIQQVCIPEDAGLLTGLNEDVLILAGS